MKSIQSILFLPTVICFLSLSNNKAEGILISQLDFFPSVDQQLSLDRYKLQCPAQWTVTPLRSKHIKGSKEHHLLGQNTTGQFSG